MSATELVIKFDAWITKEYERLRESLALTGAFDEDAFHDAYISVRRSISEDGASEKISACFLKAYKAISKRHISEAYAVYNPDELFFNQLADRVSEQTAEPDTEQAKEQLARQIQNHVKNNFTPMYFLIWESRTMRDMNYSDISAMSGMGYRRVKAGIESINNSVREHFAHAI